MWIFNQTAIQLIILKIQHVITCCLWTHCAVIIHLVTLNFLIFISKLSVAQHPSLILSNTCICNCLFYSHLIVRMVEIFLIIIDVH